MTGNKTGQLAKRGLALLLALLMLTSCVGVSAFADELIFEEAPYMETDTNEPGGERSDRGESTPGESDGEQLILFYSSAFHNDPE